jgi:hypothetical protein
VGLKNHDLFLPQQPRQPTQGEWVEERCQMHDLGRNPFYFHPLNEWTRLWTNQQWDKSAVVQPIKQQFQIPFSSSITG